MAQTINTHGLTITAQTFQKPAQKQTGEATQQLGQEPQAGSARELAIDSMATQQSSTHTRELNYSVRNANAGASMSKVAEGGLDQVRDQLQQMRELALQSANGSFSETEREKLNAKFSSLNDGISRITAATTFNGIDVLASEGESVDFQVGSSAGSGGTLSVQMAGIQSLNTDISTAEAAQISVSRIDAMISQVSSARASFNAVQNQFESTINELQTSSEHPPTANGQIQDADYALDTALFAHSLIIEQPSMALSIQANVPAQSVLQLLG